MTFETNSFKTKISTAFVILETEISRAYMTLKTNVSCSGRKGVGTWNLQVKRYTKYKQIVSDQFDLDDSIKSAYRQISPNEDTTKVLGSKREEVEGEFKPFVVVVWVFAVVDWLL